MPPALPPELIHALGQLGAACTGDVPALTSQTRALYPSFASDFVLAEALDQACSERVTAGDRNGAWWLACANAVLRETPLWPASEEAPLGLARLVGDFTQTAAAQPLPGAITWIVAGAAEPAVAPETLELVRKNASTHLERLDAELSGRTELLLAKVMAAPTPATTEAATTALTTYQLALKTTRAAAQRVMDHLRAKNPDAELARLASVMMRDLDDGPIQALASLVVDIQEKVGKAGSGQPVPSVPAAKLTELEGQMKVAFERAWAERTPANVAAFELAVRTRYEAETSGISDPTARAEALEHYIRHALSQLPAA